MLTRPELVKTERERDFGTVVDNSMKMSTQGAAVLEKAKIVAQYY